MSVGVTRERYDIILSRYGQFVKHLDGDCDPVRVFDPLTPKQLQELELIRDISKYLQNKKDEDILAANKAATAPSEGDKENAEVKPTEDTKETKETVEK